MILKKIILKTLVIITIMLGFSFKPKSFSDKSLSIIIQPFSDLPNKHLVYVYKELIKIYPNVKVMKAIDLPARAYYKPRNRYRADSLINFLRQKTPGGCVTIGLTAKDISTTKDNIKDYGIMGLGYQPGKSCVASYFRLSKKKSLEQLFKVSIHELGHTQGLPHCPEKTCFMRDAEGENHNDDEKEFCSKCRKHLESKGWNFSK